jgi:hypothetical protein
MDYFCKKTALYLLSGLLALSGCKLFSKKPQEDAGDAIPVREERVPGGVNFILRIDAEALGKVVKPGAVNYVGRHLSQTFQGRLEFGGDQVDVNLSLVPKGGDGTLIVEFYQDGEFKLMGVADGVKVASGQVVDVNEYVEIKSFQ